jgi:Ca2+-binding EF-hand superfamily protein
MKRKYLIFLMSLACLGPAVADMEFSEVDADRDGFVTAEESAVIPELKGVIADFDQDKDGKLNEEEFTNSMEVLEPSDKGG